MRVEKLMAPMNTNSRDRIRHLIEFAGGEYLGLRGPDSVAFRDPVSDVVLTLYLRALTVENIKLALKDARERVLTVAPWELTDAL